jgi:hypothetical protein
MTTVRITLNDMSITAAKLAGWVRDVAPDQYTLAEAMSIARSLIRGEAWEPPYEVVAYELEQLKNQPWSYTITMPPDGAAIRFEQRQKLYAEGEELAKRGAAGDAEAAIKFCQRFQGGDMENWCAG